MERGAKTAVTNHRELVPFYLLSAIGSAKNLVETRDTDEK